MHSLTPSPLLRLAAGALLSGTLLTACNHDGPTDPLSRVQQLQSMENALGLGAGTQYILRVRAVDADGYPVTGAAVDWTATAGTLEPVDSRSSTNGVAAKRWTAPAELGSAVVTATAGSASVQIAIAIVPAAATKLDILEDSVRFTAQGQKRIVRVVGWDQYGHPAALENDRPSAESEAATVTGITPVGDTAYVELTSAYGTHVGYAYATSASGVGRDSVRIISQPVAVGITAIGGLDSANGLATGERAQLKVTGVDSLGHPIANVDIVAAGLRLSSSDSSVATTSSDGSVTAMAPGKATIDASAGAVAYHVPVTVYAAFDVGAQRSSIATVYPQSYQGPIDQYLTDAGALLDLGAFYPHGGTGGTGCAQLRAHDASGIVTWSRCFPATYAATIVDPASAQSFVVDPTHVIHAIDITGTDRWTYDYAQLTTNGCRLAGWKDGVAAACGTVVFALTGDGKLAWSTTVPKDVVQMITTPTLTVLNLKDAVVALASDGSVAWTRTAAATDMIANAASTTYLVEGGVRAVDVGGAERWYTPGPLAACILATTEKLIVCRNHNDVTALDPADGHVRWSMTTGDLFHDMAAISGDRLLTMGAYFFAYDARTGAVLGRSPAVIDEDWLAISSGYLSASTFGNSRVFSTSFTPGTEWSQKGGNAGHGNRVTP